MQAKFRDNPTCSCLPFPQGGGEESAPLGSFKSGRNTPVFFAWFHDRASALTDCLSPSDLGSCVTPPLLARDRHSSELLASKHPKIPMCPGPRPWLLTVDADLAVPILVARSQQRLGFGSRQVSGICSEALQDGSRKKRRGGSQVKVTLQEPCADGGLASGTGSQQRACVRLCGAGSRAVAVPSWVGVWEGQAVLSDGSTSLQAGHLPLAIYSANATNTKVSSLCPGRAGNGHREILGNCLKR